MGIRSIFDDRRNRVWIRVKNNQRLQTKCYELWNKNIMNYRAEKITKLLQ